MVFVVKRAASVLLLVVWLFLPLSSAFALSFIRDAESEDFIRRLSNPLIIAAGLSPEQIDFYIINSEQINAFVQGGNNIFISSGLIQAVDNSDMLAGVIAHELGHVAGSHLIKGRDSFEEAAVGNIIANILGAAIMVAGGGEGGAAVMSAGSQISERMMLAKIREHEGTADEAALGYLESAGISAMGLAKTFEMLRAIHREFPSKADAYMRTHPINSERIAHINNYLKRNPANKALYNKDYAGNRALERVQAKITAFLSKNPIEAKSRLTRINSDNNKIAAIYRDIILAHRNHNVSFLDKKYDELMQKRPYIADPWLWELWGQIFYESGRFKESILANQQAVELRPEQPLLHLALAQSYISHAQMAGGSGLTAHSRNKHDPFALIRQTEPQYDSNIVDPNILWQKAVQHLEIALKLDKTAPSGWRYLAQSYSRLGEYEGVYLAMAEEALLKRKYEDAIEYAQRVVEDDDNEQGNRNINNAPKPSEMHRVRRANDIIEISKHKQRKLED